MRESMLDWVETQLPKTLTLDHLPTNQQNLQNSNLDKARLWMIPNVSLTHSQEEVEDFNMLETQLTKYRKCSMMGIKKSQKVQELEDILVKSVPKWELNIVEYFKKILRTYNTMTFKKLMV